MAQYYPPNSQQDPQYYDATTGYQQEYPQQFQEGYDESYYTSDANYNSQAYTQDSYGTAQETGIVPPDYRQFCLTVNAFPQNAALRVETHLPFAAVIQPLASVDSPPRAINFGVSGVIRCRACRAYINPYVSFNSTGTTWTCNLCGRTNELPSTYAQEISDPSRRHDHPELLEGTFEIVAPPEYTVRAPQPPTFVFVIDVSMQSSATGMLQTVTQSILASLDSLPGYPRTNIGFITFDSSVHYYSLNSSAKSPKLYVLPDIDDMQIPAPYDLLVNLQEHRSMVELLLNLLPQMHQSSTDPEAATGPAVEAAVQMAKSIGGKIILFSSVLPSLGKGSLKNRDNPRLLGTDKEHSLLVPSIPVYRDIGQSLTTSHLMCDVFLFPQEYIDVATVGELSRNSGGQLFFYPGFNASSDADRLLHDLYRVLSREQAWEAVMRVRASRGVKVHNYFGHFYMRSHDLLAVPNCDADKAFVVEFTNDESPIPTTVVTFQSALLYSNSDGERRLRIHTAQVPVCSDAVSLFDAVDALALANFVAKKAVLNLRKSSLHSSREIIQYLCTDIITAYTKAQKGYVKLEREEDYPEALRYLPFYTLSLLKNVAFKDGTDVAADPRMAALLDVGTMGISDFDLFIRPRMYRIDVLSGPEGLVDEFGGTKLPLELNLTAADITSDSVVLLDDGRHFLIRIGANASAQFLDQLFEEGAASRNVSLIFLFSL